MTLSLLEHVETQHQQQISQLLPLAATALPHQMLAIALGQLIVLDRQDSQQLYDAILQQNSLFWQQALSSEAIQQLAALYQLDEVTFKNALLGILQIISEEIRQLDEMASFGHTGVSELIQGQQEYLAGQVSDEIWQSIGLPELQGQHIVEDNNPNLNQSMADLSKMMSEASQYQQQAVRSSPSAKNTGRADSMLEEHIEAQRDITRSNKPIWFIAVIVVIILATLLSTFVFG